MKLLQLFLILVFYHISLADDIQQILKQSQKDLEAANKALAKFYQEDSKKHLKLSKAIKALEVEIKNKSAKAAKINQIQDAKLIDFAKLKREQSAWQDQYSYMQNTLASYLSKFELSLNNHEKFLYQEQLNKLKDINLAQDKDEQALITLQIQLSEAAIDRIFSQLNLYNFDGKAIDDQGNIYGGTYIKMGPLSYFQSQEKQYFLSIKDNKKALVTSGDFAESFQCLNSNNHKPCNIIFDPTFVNAFSIMAEQETIKEHLQKGGVWIYPILFFGTLAFLVAILKFLQIYSFRLGSSKHLNNIVTTYQEKGEVEALKLIKSKTCLNNIFTNILNNIHQNTEVLEELVYEEHLKVKAKLSKFLYIIATTASIAPLLGLLGTVTGIIKTFKLIMVFGSADPRMLSSGISEALISTEIGLIVAIPSLILFVLLRRKVQRILENIEKVSVMFINRIKIDN